MKKLLIATLLASTVGLLASPHAQACSGKHHHHHHHHHQAA
jgi:hypothetical protein